MLNSRSKASTNKVWLGFAALLLVAGFATRAHADRKRVVILPFDGDEKAEKFHGALVKLIKKTHTVVSTSKWETTAEGLSAEKVNDGNIKKVAKKMKVDGVIEGTISKRRDEYIIKLKLRSGTSGKVIAKVDTKAEGTKLDGQASRDIKDELVDAVDNLESVRGGGGEEEEDAKPAKKPKKGEDEEEAKPAKKPKKGEDEEEAKPAKKPKKGEDEEAKPAKKPKKGEDEEEAKPSKFGGNKKLEKGNDAGGEETALKSKKDPEEEENPNPKPKKGGKKVAAKDPDGEEIGEVAEPGVKLTGPEALTPANRAIDAVIGLSLNARRLSWKADGDLGPSTGPGLGKPPNYNGVPAPGAVLDITAYPLAFGHKKKGVLTGLGVQAMYDQALLISSKLGDGTKLKTQANRLLIGGVFRCPLGSKAEAPVVGGRLAFMKQSFQIQMGSDLPNVNYSAIQPGVFFKLPVGKLVFNADLGYQLISNTGQMTKGNMTGYGKASVSGIDFKVSGDYALTKAIFARGGLQIERIGYKFNGSADTLATLRDNDPEQDVKGATDMYIGAAFAIGYLY
jgi:hypothetical protein